jgi:hypothetical protein
MQVFLPKIVANSTFLSENMHFNALKLAYVIFFLYLCSRFEQKNNNNKTTKNMKKLNLWALSIVVALGALMTSCLILRGTTVVKNESVYNYKYVYVMPTVATQSVYGATVGTGGTTVGATTSSSVVPSDIIAGQFVKNGFIRVADVKPETASQTLSVSYSETDIRKVGGTEATEVTIQAVNAATNALVCSVTAEGKSKTQQAEEVRMAIDRAMKEMMKK